MGELERNSEALGRPCVLVAEDEDMVRELAIEVLSASGYRTLEAKHGGEAVEVFDAHLDQIDAVLLDLSMPVLDGLEVLEHIKKARPQTRVILTSGFDDYGAVEDHQHDKTVGFLQKPYRGAGLVAEIRAMLAT